MASAGLSVSSRSLHTGVCVCTNACARMYTHTHTHHLIVSHSQILIMSPHRLLSNVYSYLRKMRWYSFSSRLKNSQKLTKMWNFKAPHGGGYTLMNTSHTNTHVASCEEFTFSYKFNYVDCGLACLSIKKCVGVFAWCRHMLTRVPLRAQAVNTVVAD